MRPTNIHDICINEDSLRSLKESGIQENVWNVDVNALDPVTFKDCYADGHNQSDRVAGEWLLLNFKYMCPTTIDSDVFVGKNDIEMDAWTRLTFEKDEEPVDASAVMPVLEASGLDYYGPGDYNSDHKWPCLEVITASLDGESWDATDAISEVDALLEPVGWELGSIVGRIAPSVPESDGVYRRVSVWTVVPLGHDDRDDRDDDDSEWPGDEDGWHGILLNHVFVVDEERSAEVLDAAGLRVLKHEDTGTVVAQVTFCGMSNGAYCARAGFLLAAERGWPILTEKGWRRGLPRPANRRTR